MKVMMALDRRTYVGPPTSIVKKLREAAIHMKTRDSDAYMRAVAARLRAEEQVEIDLEGDSLEERCEAFLAGNIRTRLLLPVFLQEHLDSAAIRVLRRARGLTQEQLASLLQISFTTVNRWEAAGERLSPNPKLLGSIEEQLFTYFWRSSQEPVPLDTPVIPLTSFLADVRKRTRRGFSNREKIINSTLSKKHT
jgi:transcriptional regulator with XRE-family HTH domain